MIEPTSADQESRCVFCRRSEAEAEGMIAAPGGGLCFSCSDAFRGMVEEHRAAQWTALEGALALSPLAKTLFMAGRVPLDRLEGCRKLAEDEGISLFEAVVASGLASEEELLGVLVRHHGVHALGPNDLPPEAGLVASEVMAEHGLRAVGQFAEVGLDDRRRHHSRGPAGRVTLVVAWPAHTPADIAEKVTAATGLTARLVVAAPGRKQGQAHSEGSGSGDPDESRPPAPPDDWRRQGQEDYLMGATLVRDRYQPYSETWDHDHCEFCSTKLSCLPGDASRGYRTPDSCRWICERCFDDFRVEFGWKLSTATDEKPEGSG